MVANSDVRLAIIDAVLADVATRSDLEKLRSEIERGSRGSRTGSQHLENRVNAIVAMLARLKGQMDLSVKLFTAFNLPTSIAVIGILLRTVFV
jgi:hypothetical protein